jgi:acyl-CoA synthetase (AMP-forming)/AMP-acid ligase II
LVTTFDKIQLEQHNTACPMPAGSPDGVTLISCGQPVAADVEVLIVHPEECTAVPAGMVGEVWVHSGSKTAGYWGQPEATEERFGAQLRDGSSTTQYLRTGDLAFQLDGELYVTGRLKDIIILNGRNLYPNDLEDSLRGCHPAIRPGGVAVFGVDSAAIVWDSAHSAGHNHSADSAESGDSAAAGSSAAEVVVALVEVHKGGGRRTAEELDGIVAAVRGRLAEAQDIQAYSVVVGTAGLILKTTSGKVQRSHNRQAFLDGKMGDEGANVAPRPPAPSR